MLSFVSRVRPQLQRLITVSLGEGFGRRVPIGLARPLLALLMTRASYEEQARWRAGERVYTITRAGCPGIQAYAQVGLAWRLAIVR